jgi:hypothetical protein
MKPIGMLCFLGLLATVAALRTAWAGEAKGLAAKVGRYSVKQRQGLLKKEVGDGKSQGQVPSLGHFVMGKTSRKSATSTRVQKMSSQIYKTIKQRNLRQERRLDDGHGAHGGHPAPSHNNGHKSAAEVEEEYDLPEESVMKARINYPDLGLVNLEKGTYLFKIT